ncbi:MAG TPA: hypothetical protein VLK25_05995, partial [Allosphingosinicella sp.]|nr:hypothetical protein [Allosphingosinicella sp.]
MIYPTRLAVLLAGAIAPLALLIALAVPAMWPAGLILLALLLACCALDMLLGVSGRSVSVSAAAPHQAGIGDSFPVTLDARFAGRRPAAVQLALGVSGPAEAPFGLTAGG